MCQATVTVLAHHRQAVLEIVDGLDETQLRRPVLPSGWTVLGLVEHPTADVLAFYRDAGDRLTTTLMETPCDAVPQGQLPPDLAPLAGSVGAVAAHLLEEVARHAGHLDVARELLDARTGLGPR